ncbi:V-type ATP synthase subunit C [Candidatus Gugararchaeum adminiculabundum]|nr:V-type ATP synthase subunit C [Candidatus Gugararchaeum adminiculabundum]
MSIISAISSKIPARLKSPLRSQTLIYAYSNARVKAMRTNLLKPSMVEEMVSLDSITSIAGLLERTTYREDLTHFSLRYSGADLVELALGRNYGRMAQKLFKFTPTDGKSTLKAILGRWDAYNLKTILLAISVGKKTEEVEPYLVPAGELGEYDLKELSECANLEEFAKKLRRTSYGQIFSQLLKKHSDEARQNDFTGLLAGIDSHYYNSVLQQVSATDSEGAFILSLINTEVDGKNLSTILRAKKNKLTAQVVSKLMIQGGTLTEQTLKKLIEAETVEGAVKLLKSKYDLASALEQYLKDGALSHFEIEFERTIARKGVSTLRRSQLSVGAIVGFLYLKEQEVGNIRRIVRLKDFNLPPEEIKKELV